MKKIFTIAFLFFVCSAQTIYSQDGHRLKNTKEPYDIFYLVKPNFSIPMGEDLKKNYNNAMGVNFGLEYMFQEIKLGVGLELGYSIIMPNTYKIKYLPAKHLFPAHQIPFTIYANYYLHNDISYYNFWDRLKPYIGLGLGAIWGRYDYSLSTEENKGYDSFGYYLRDYEGQSGIRVGLLPRVGLLIAGKTQAFGFEIGYNTYFKWDRLEKQEQLSFGFTYVYIIQ